MIGRYRVNERFSKRGSAVDTVDWFREDETLGDVAIPYVDVLTVVSEEVGETPGSERRGAEVTQPTPL